MLSSCSITISTRLRSRRCWRPPRSRGSAPRFTSMTISPTRSNATPTPKSPSPAPIISSRAPSANAVAPPCKPRFTPARHRLARSWSQRSAARNSSATPFRWRRENGHTIALLQRSLDQELAPFAAARAHLSFPRAPRPRDLRRARALDRARRGRASAPAYQMGHAK